ncbi:MAG: hypothetical protein ACLR4Z_01850 [Butyricicoccaceae bacterium]
MQGYYNIYVGITSPNERSMKFHKAMGFVISGAYQESMYTSSASGATCSGWAGACVRTTAHREPTVPFPEISDSPLVSRALRQAMQRIHDI